MGAPIGYRGNQISQDIAIDGGYMSEYDLEDVSPTNSFDSFDEANGAIQSYFEFWDYVGGSRFRGLVAERDGKNAMFVFYERNCIGHDLKPGLLALLELCSIPEMECSDMTICIDRNLKQGETKSIMKNFSWVGFEPTTLAEWNNYGDILSERWIFMSMETD